MLAERLGKFKVTSLGFEPTILVPEPLRYRVAVIGEINKMTSKKGRL
jgi:hypothetical protein